MNKSIIVESSAGHLEFASYLLGKFVGAPFVSAEEP